MPNKIDTDQLKKILTSHKLNNKLIADIMESVAQELSSSEVEKVPGVKKQFVTLTTAPGISFVIQMPEGESPTTVTDKLFRAAYEFNASPKGKRLPVKTIGEICEHVSAKFLKAQDIWVKTKEPVELVATANNMPAAK